MSNDTKWIIGTVLGTGLAVVTAVLTAAGLLLAQVGGLNDRIDDVNQRIDDLRSEMRTEMRDLRNEMRDFRNEVNERMAGFDTRLRHVEIAFGKVDQRLLIIERFVLPTPEAPPQ